MKAHSKILRMMALALLGLSFTSLGPAYSNNQQDAKIEAAALDKLRAKLGDIRGTISIRDRGVFLTRTMIERWKPVASQARGDDS